MKADILISLMFLPTEELDRRDFLETTIREYKNSYDEIYRVMTSMGYSPEEIERICKED